MRTLRFIATVVAVAGSAGALACGAGTTDVIPHSPDAGSPEAGAQVPNGDDEASAPVVPVGPVGPEMTGLHVVGNHIENAQGHAVVLHGVNRSGTEYKCVAPTGASIFDGRSDDISVQAIASWKANAVRIPLNESCWLAINGAPAVLSGSHYKDAIKNYVVLLHTYHIVPILELHWVGPGTSLATAPQQPMPDLDHAPDFWKDVTTTFQDDDGVVFEPYNEPFPGRNPDATAAWTCWQQGCTTNVFVFDSQGRTVASAVTYSTVGMQGLVDAIRHTEQALASPSHLILVGGIQFSNDLSQWLAYEPTDPVGNLGAAWHVYNFNGCRTASCWAMAPAAVAASVPLVATEIGENDCQDVFITPLMAWLDSKSSSYLAWAWDAYGLCTSASPYSLITDYPTGTPNPVANGANLDGGPRDDAGLGYAQTYHDHIVGL